MRAPAGGRCIGWAVGYDVGRHLQDNAIAVLEDGCFNGLEEMTYL